MIIGIGLDVTELDRITLAYTRKAAFAERVLTEKEQAIFHQLTGTRQMEFLAGRFAAKEAFSKAYGTGIGKLSFQDMEILPGEKGKPEVTHSPFDGNVWVSISHSSNIVVAQVILEK
ncbi:holo-ACP synthase [Jeotgalibaca caeni]|uniref:holo-ACP synthase n=1 Tax=Jeotgalibaca caeni TaxID=3028623 RepID=UPI00237E5D37|nr:holo-ACP synthase [Jeotgalibaca caeni]MDE1548478.1 holo-ACP synthase [Jeotgalibaca caeni]